MYRDYRESTPGYTWLAEATSADIDVLNGAVSASSSESGIKRNQ